MLDIDGYKENGLNVKNTNTTYSRLVHYLELLVHVQEIVQTTQYVRIQQLEINNFENTHATTRYVRKYFAEECSNFKNNTQDSDDRQEEFFPSS